MDEDLKSHLKESFKTVHDIMPHVAARLGYYTRAIEAEFSVTINGAWQPITVSAAPAAATVIMRLMVHAWNFSGADSVTILFRKNGSSEAYEDGCTLRLDATVTDGYANIFVELDASKKYQYLATKTGDPWVKIKQIGYWVIPT